MLKFGLIGKNIEYSFSRKYFTEKFEKNDINASYVNFDCQNIAEVREVLQDRDDECLGFNVTIPYKQAIIPHLDEMNKHASAIGAVNVIKRLNNGRLKGYNTDYIGFRKSLKPFLSQQNHKCALILGTGGASKAVAYTLELEDISFKYVSRNPKKGQFAYEDLTPAVLNKYTLIINTTPLGTFPNVTDCPKLSYRQLNSKHLLYDLVYNPEETQFLKNGKAQGAMITNGYSMLKQQAEAAWRIWK
ncbi:MULTISPECIES: shikimate dehydrogenase family protein [unclassified Leeuwenhoekiella]|nr:MULTISPECIES: shikimate dehydrogenase [unclassified Leeuwenhoekiella]MAW95099.1 shikimate dehydrogenase [Leeuwenhoekiella sp.]MBA79819.1 shikimate dehydrogenase [Leeuwenhoekiella sp.]|tara:strand:+ start:32712 stop:33446 length:735 start_codon:yes stop_codon:yes gene_type:complete